MAWCYQEYYKYIQTKLKELAKMSHSYSKALDEASLKGMRSLSLRNGSPCTIRTGEDTSLQMAVEQKVALSWTHSQPEEQTCPSSKGTKPLIREKRGTGSPVLPDLCFSKEQLSCAIKSEAFEVISPPAADDGCECSDSSAS